MNPRTERHIRLVAYVVVASAAAGLVYTIAQGHTTPKDLLVAALHGVAISSILSVFEIYLVVSGRVTGAWGRTVSEKGVHIRVKPFRSLTMIELRGLEAAAERHGRFMNLPVTLTQA